MIEDMIGPERIKVLVVDDSWVFRRVLRDIFENSVNIRVVGEASNGIEALELVLRLCPDVIVLDMEMPVMDGVTALQHLMIHTPTPTVMFSSLTSEGTARAFDALKYGAVDFVSKATLFRGSDMAAHKEPIIKKIIKASLVTIDKADSIGPLINASGKTIKFIEKVVFCEDCGARNVVGSPGKGVNKIHCCKCGDWIPLDSGGEQYRRMKFLTIIGAGEGGYSNLLRVIPALSPAMGGALMIVVHDDPEHVDAFAKYLDSICNMRILRIQDGLTLEGGCCYIASGNESVSFSTYKAHYTMQVSHTPVPGQIGAISTVMVSAARLLKSQVSGIVLSGSEDDAIEGINAINKEQGTTIALNPLNVFSKEMVKNVIKKCKIDMVVDEGNLAETIDKMHYQHKKSVETA